MRTTRSTTLFKILLSVACTMALMVWIVGCGSGSGPTSPAAPVASGGSGDSGGSGGSGDGGGSGDTGGTDGSGQSGTLTIQMRDDATDEICELWVYFADLKVKPVGQPVTRLGGVNEAFDLLTLQDGKYVVLGDFEMTAGDYQFIEMLLDEDRSYVIEKDEATGNCLKSAKEPLRAPLQIPSEKFKIKGPPFEVTKNTVAKIHFDAPKSLKKKGGNGNSSNGNSNGNGKDKDDESKGWMLKADVTLEDTVQDPK